MAKLRKMAESLAGVKKEEKPPEEVVYKSRGLSLQQLNPEISVGGDLIAYFRDQDGTRQRTDALHFTMLEGATVDVGRFRQQFGVIKSN